MIEPGHRCVDRCHAPTRRFGRPFEQQNPYSEPARRGDLAIGRRTAAVFGDDDIDGVLAQQRTIGLFAERSASLNVSRLRHRESRFDWIHAANEVPVLRRLGEPGDLLAAKREKYIPWLMPQRAYRIARARHLGPRVTGNLPPGRTTQREQRRAGLRGCADRVCGDRRSVRMGRIDQCVDAMFTQIVRETVDSAESAPAHRYRLGQGRRGAAGERQCRRDVVTVRDPQGKLSRLRRAPENQDMSAHATH